MVCRRVGFFEVLGNGPGVMSESFAGCLRDDMAADGADQLDAISGIANFTPRIHGRSLA